MLGLVFGGYLALTYSISLSRLIPAVAANALGAKILSFWRIFCELWMIAYISGAIVRYLLRLDAPVWTGRVAGGIMGSLKGLLIVSVALILITASLSERHVLISRSSLFPHVAIISEAIDDFISRDVRDGLTSRLADRRKVRHQEYPTGLR